MIVAPPSEVGGCQSIATISSFAGTDSAGVIVVGKSEGFVASITATSVATSIGAGVADGVGVTTGEGVGSGSTTAGNVATSAIGIIAMAAGFKGASGRFTVNEVSSVIVLIIFVAILAVS